MLKRRLRKAVEKVKFLLSFNIYKFLLRHTSTSPSAGRRIGFKQHHAPGLLDVADDGSEFEVFFDALTPGHAFVVAATPTQHSPSPAIYRTITSTWSAIDRSVRNTPSPLPSCLSCSPSGDVDRRAEEFINRFHERLRMERQVSLDLRYASLNRSSPSPEVILP